MSSGYLGWLLSTHPSWSGDTYLGRWKYGLCQRVGMGQRASIAFLSFLGGRCWKNVATWVPYGTFGVCFNRNISRISALCQVRMLSWWSSTKHTVPVPCCQGPVTNTSQPCSMCPLSFHIYSHGVWKKIKPCRFQQMVPKALSGASPDSWPWCFLSNTSSSDPFHLEVQAYPEFQNTLPFSDRSSVTAASSGGPLDLPSASFDCLSLPVSVGRQFSTFFFFHKPQTLLPFLLAVDDLNSFTKNLDEAS